MLRKMLINTEMLRKIHACEIISVSIVFYPEVSNVTLYRNKALSISQIYAHRHYLICMAYHTYDITLHDKYLHNGVSPVA